RKLELGGPAEFTRTGVRGGVPRLEHLDERRAALAVGGLHDPGDLLAVAAERLPVGGESREQLLVRQDGGRDLGPDTRLGVPDEGVGDEELARRALPGAAVPVEERDGD